ncbi:MAG: hypothetical protein RBS80_08225 [Thermoguttaceae bacterium]|nr:hypothetical protein [Thermoguttaceae bacterium]
MTALNKEKLLRQLSKRQRQRRQQRRSPPALEVKPASHGLMNRMMHDHQDLLQNIEFFVIQAYHHDASGGIDDRAVMNGYRSALLGNRPDDSPAGDVAQAIADARSMREEVAPVSDELWHDAIRVLMRSVKNHSGLLPGETSYLDFVGRFVR